MCGPVGTYSVFYFPCLAGFEPTIYRLCQPLCQINQSLGSIIKDLFFNEIDLLTEDTNKEMSLYMISLIAQLKDN